MKENWTYKKFEDCLEKVKYTSKISTSDYLAEGKYPIISQEEGLIAGFWNNEADVFRTNKPVVIFGDHTRILKYVDFDFVLGADGVKILKPIDGLFAKFLFYYLQRCDIPSLGYSRHYKLLKEIEIPIPNSEIQSRIVSELDLLQSIIDKQKAQLKELDNLAQAIFYDMFGDPITNTKGWEKCELNKNVEEMFLGPFGSSLKVDSYVDKGSSYCMVYEQKHAIQAKMDFEDTHYINEEKYNSLKRFTVVGGDFIMSCRGTIGRIFQLPLDAPLGIIHPSLMKIRIKNSYSPVFFKFLLTKTMEEQVTNGNCVQMAITAKELGKKHLVLPPLSLQQSFAQKVESIERQKELINQSIREAQTLFDSRMEYYFGE